MRGVNDLQQSLRRPIFDEDHRARETSLQAEELCGPGFLPVFLWWRKADWCDYFYNRFLFKKLCSIRFFCYAMFKYNCELFMTITNELPSFGTMWCRGCMFYQNQIYRSHHIHSNTSASQFDYGRMVCILCPSILWTTPRLNKDLFFGALSKPAVSFQPKTVRPSLGEKGVWVYEWS